MEDINKAGMAGFFKSARATSIVCTILPLIIFSTYCGLYWGMLSQANDINDEYEDLGDFLGVDVDVDPYNLCAGAGGADPDFDTKWMVLLKFNAFLYLVLTICMFFTLFGSFFMPLYCFTCCSMTCGGCAHLALIIVTGVFRFSTEGKACAENDTPLAEDGTTYADHGDKIKALFISQCVLLIFVGICQGMALQCGLVAGGGSMMSLMMKRQAQGM